MEQMLCLRKLGKCKVSTKGFACLFISILSFLATPALGYSEAISAYINPIFLPKLDNKSCKTNLGADEFERLRLKQLSGENLSELQHVLLVKGACQHGVPRWGIEYLTRALATGEIAEKAEHYALLGDLSYQARDYASAVSSYEKAEKQKFPHMDYRFWGYAAFRTRDCKSIDTVLSTKPLSERGVDSAWRFVGMCYYEKAQTYGKQTCWDPSPGQGELRHKMQTAAIRAFKRLTPTQEGYGRAQHWIKFIETRIETEELPECGQSIAKELCFIKIRQAYDALVFTSRFELDEDCALHKEEFDRLYRTSLPK